MRLNRRGHCKLLRPDAFGSAIKRFGFDVGKSAARKESIAGDKACSRMRLVSQGRLHFSLKNKDK
jgi:hypothetical protein